MKTENRAKFIHEVDAGKGRFMAKRPFKLDKQDQRTFVRIEISSPLALRTLKDGCGHITTEDESATISGTILNISASGILADLDQLMAEGDIVSMRFELQDELALENILGLIKRCESDGEGVLAGIEFLTPERLSDILSGAELELLENDFTHFDAGVERLLAQYVQRVDRVPAGVDSHAQE